MGTNGFRYKTGDRPLEGYTIQRGVGRGGFGEVYFAVSDSGRQVALKSVHTYEKIELRGISQCMNLKSPHLVTIFDIKYNDDSQPFVVMEYVAGPSLKDLLDQSPSGLGEQKAAYFIREIAKGLTYLHDRGIVHRDLKPGNIFYENGYVMIGDYGLSKVIASNQHSAQTMTVGTVHYMAPEIGAGQYDRTIDIYALGVLLFEMLTGRVPFVGASLGEILMKHLASEVDVSSLHEPFASIVTKAMAKNPADRYQTAQEMVEALFGVDHVRNSVSVFSPDSLTMVAGQAAAAVTTDDDSDETDNDFDPHRTEDARRRHVHVGAGGVTVDKNGRRVHVGIDGIHVDDDDRRPGAKKGKRQWQHADRDPIPLSQRLMLAAIAIGAVSMAIGAVSMRTHADIVTTVLAAVGAMIGALAGIAGASQRILPRFNREKGMLFNLTYGGLASTGVALLAGPVALMSHNDMLVRSIGTVMAAVYFMNFHKRTSPTRRERITSDLAVSAGIFALFLNWIFGGGYVMTIGCLVGISLASQAMSPFRPRLIEPADGAPLTEDERREVENFRQHFNAARDSVQTESARRSAHDAPARATAARHTASQATRVADAMRATDHVRAQTLAPQPVPTALKIFWLTAFLLFATSVPVLFSVAAYHHNGEVFGLWATVELGVAIGCFVKLRMQHFLSWWSALIRPALQCLLMTLSGFGLSVLLLGRGIGGSEAFAFSVIAFFPMVVFFALLFLPTDFFSTANNGSESRISQRTLATPSGRILSQPISPHSRGLALGLTFLCFCGLSGIHRMTVGKIGTGILWLLTLGLLGFGQLIDFIMILVGTFTDKQGRPLLHWQGYSEQRHAAPALDTASASTLEFASPSDSETRRRRRAKNHPVLASLAVLTLLLSLVVAIVPAWHLPVLAKAGAPLLIELNAPLADSFDTPDWPFIIERATMMLAVTLLFVAMLAMMLARRHADATHILRVPIGAGLIVAAVAATRSASMILTSPTGVAALRELFDGQRIGHGIVTLLNLMMSPMMFGGAFLLLAAIAVLCWPRTDETHNDTHATTQAPADAATATPDGGNI
jgi:hypothetical protein